MENAIRRINRICYVVSHGVVAIVFLGILIMAFGGN